MSRTYRSGFDTRSGKFSKRLREDKGNHRKNRKLTDNNRMYYPEFFKFRPSIMKLRDKDLVDDIEAQEVEGFITELTDDEQYLAAIFEEELEQYREDIFVITGGW